MFAQPSLRSAVHGLVGKLRQGAARVAGRTARRPDPRPGSEGLSEVARAWDLDGRAIDLRKL